MLFFFVRLLSNSIIVVTGAEVVEVILVYSEIEIAAQVVT